MADAPKWAVDLQRSVDALANLVGRHTGTLTRIEDRLETVERKVDVVASQVNMLSKVMREHTHRTDGSVEI